jgi:hypothetical protein
MDFQQEFLKDSRVRRFHWTCANRSSNEEVELREYKSQVPIWSLPKKQDPKTFVFDASLELQSQTQLVIIDRILHRIYEVDEAQPIDSNCSVSEQYFYDSPTHHVLCWTSLSKKPSLINKINNIKSNTSNIISDRGNEANKNETGLFKSFDSTSHNEDSLTKSADHKINDSKSFKNADNPILLNEYSNRKNENNFFIPKYDYENDKPEDIRRTANTNFDYNRYVAEHQTKIKNQPIKADQLDASKMSSSVPENQETSKFQPISEPNLLHRSSSKRSQISEQIRESLQTIHQNLLYENKKDEKNEQAAIEPTKHVNINTTVQFKEPEEELKSKKIFQTKIEKTNRNDEKSFSDQSNEVLVEIKEKRLIEEKLNNQYKDTSHQPVGKDRGISSLEDSSGSKIQQFTFSSKLNEKSEDQPIIHKEQISSNQNTVSTVEKVKPSYREKHIFQDSPELLQPVNNLNKVKELEKSDKQKISNTSFSTRSIEKVSNQIKSDLKIEKTNKGSEELLEKLKRQREKAESNEEAKKNSIHRIEPIKSKSTKENSEINNFKPEVPKEQFVKTTNSIDLTLKNNNESEPKSLARNSQNLYERAREKTPQQALLPRDNYTLGIEKHSNPQKESKRNSNQIFILEKEAQNSIPSKTTDSSSLNKISSLSKPMAPVLPTIGKFNDLPITNQIFLRADSEEKSEHIETITSNSKTRNSSENNSLDDVTFSETLFRSVRTQTDPISSSSFQPDSVSKSSNQFEIIRISSFQNKKELTPEKEPVEAHKVKQNQQLLYRNERSHSSRVQSQPSFSLQADSILKKLKTNTVSSKTVNVLSNSLYNSNQSSVEQQNGPSYRSSQTMGLDERKTRIKSAEIYSSFGLNEGNPSEFHPSENSTITVETGRKSERALQPPFKLPIKARNRQVEHLLTTNVLAKADSIEYNIPTNLTIKRSFTKKETKEEKQKYFQKNEAIVAFDSELRGELGLLKQERDDTPASIDEGYNDSNQKDLAQIDSVIFDNMSIDEKTCFDSDSDSKLVFKRTDDFLEKNKRQTEKIGQWDSSYENLSIYSIDKSKELKPSQTVEDSRRDSLLLDQILNPKLNTTGHDDVSDEEGMFYKEPTLTTRSANNANIDKKAPSR